LIVPTLIDFLVAPWRVFEVLFGTPHAAQGASFCSMVTSGAEVLEICRIAGYEMPGFILRACLAILVLFAASSFILISQCARLRRDLDRIAIGLASLKSVEGLGPVRALMAASPVMHYRWGEFEASLLPSPSGKEYCTTDGVEAFFSRNALIEDHVSAGFFGSVPGILTGLGLLMTFVAILEGLSHVSVAANMDVQGIGGLINGLSGKFASSIVAVTCAVLFVFVERVAYSLPGSPHRRLLASLSTRFKRRTAEQLLLSINQQLAEMRGTFHRAEGA
jgi:hypothetical protein